MASSSGIKHLEGLIHDLEKAVGLLKTHVEVKDNGRLTVSESKAPGKPLAGSIDVPVDAASDIKAAKITLLEATTTIQQLVSSPSDFHRQLALNNQYAACVRWLCYFDIPTYIPEQNTGIKFTELSLKASVPLTTLVRICLMASTAGFFHCPTSEDVAHTPISLGYRSPAPLLETMLFLTETSVPTAYKMVEMTTSSLLEPATSPKTAFQIANNTDLGFFPYLSQHPTVAQRLASGMKDLATASEAHVQHLVHGFDWASLGTAHVVDMGGSLGSVSVTLAKSFPNLTFTVQDLPPVIAQAKKQQVGSDISGRIVFEPHNFLQPLAPTSSSSSADVFLIRQCLQNHPHEIAVKIIQQLVPWLTRKTSSRIIINNVVLPSPGDLQIGKREEAAARVRDLFMMQAMDGQERDMEQWTQLLRDTDSRLKIVSVQKPEGSILSVIEVKLQS